MRWLPLLVALALLALAPVAYADVTPPTGTNPQLSPSPGSLNFFNDVNAGPSAPQTVTVTNTGDADVQVTSVVISDPANFSQVAGDCTAGRTLSAGDSCTIGVSFDPSTTGPDTATVTVNSNAPAISVDLNGLATQDPLGLFGSLTLGTLDVGSGKSRVKAAALTNTTAQPVTLTKIRLLDPNAGRFLWASGLTGDCSVGQTLAVWESCKVRILFVPQSEGPQSAALTVASTAGMSGLAITATGKPGLRIPWFSPRATSTKKRRLTVPVRPLGGTVRAITVRVASRSGKLLGTGKLSSAADEANVGVKLGSALTRGTYIAKAGGRDAASNAINAPALTFQVR